MARATSVEHMVAKKVDCPTRSQLEMSLWSGPLHWAHHGGEEEMVSLTETANPCVMDSGSRVSACSP